MTCPPNCTCHGKLASGAGIMPLSRELGRYFHSPLPREPDPIPEMPRVTTPVRKLDPAVWSDLK